jgi:hypothetical protein
MAAGIVAKLKVKPKAMAQIMSAVAATAKSGRRVT